MSGESDTPRTDAEIEDARNVALEYECSAQPDATTCEVVRADFALGLERELNAARAEIEGWRNKWNAAVEMAAIAQLGRDLLTQDLAEIRSIIVKGGGAADVLRFLDTPSSDGKEAAGE